MRIDLLPWQCNSNPSWDWLYFISPHYSSGYSVTQSFQINLCQEHGISKGAKLFKDGILSSGLSAHLEGAILIPSASLMWLSAVSSDGSYQWNPHLCFMVPAGINPALLSFWKQIGWGGGGKVWTLEQTKLGLLLLWSKKKIFLKSKI